MMHNSDFASWVALLTKKGARPQYRMKGDAAICWFTDASDVYQCIIPAGTDDYAAWDATIKPLSNLPLDIRSLDGRQRISSEKGITPKRNAYTHNFCDRTTWYTMSVRVVEEMPTKVGANTYQLSHANVIDTYHGKLFQERQLKDAGGHSYRVAVTVDGSPMRERDPHYSTPQAGEDFTVDYATGLLTFLTLFVNGEVKVTYHYATTSDFWLIPGPGLRLSVVRAEAQFSVPIDPKDTVLFEVYGYAGAFAPQLNLPPEQLIPLESYAYQTIADYQADAMGSYPTYPAMGEAGNWRSMPYPVTVFDWAYAEGTPLLSSRGMRVLVRLEHDEPFVGSMATVTLYCTEEAE